MKKHILLIEIEEEEKGASIVDVKMTVKGNLHALSKGVCGLLASNEDMRDIFMEALVNAIAVNVKIQGDPVRIDYTKEEEEEKLEN